MEKKLKLILKSAIYMLIQMESSNLKIILLIHLMMRFKKLITTDIWLERQIRMI